MGKVKQEIHLQKKETLAKGMARLSRLWVERARQHNPKRGRLKDDDVHEVRLCIKRMRALIRLIRDSADQGVCEREDRRLRQAARRLAPYRDQEVMSKTLSLLAHRIQEDEFVHLLEILRRTWFRDRPFVHSEIIRFLRLAIRDLDRSSEHLGSMRFVRHGWAGIETGLRKTYRQARMGWREVITEPGEESFHRWRRHVKDLQYDLELILPIAPRRLGKMRRKLVRLANWLGLDHDLIVLAHFLVERGRQTAPFVSLGKTLDFLEKWSQDLRGDSCALGDKLFAEKYAQWSHNLERKWSLWRGR